MVKESELNKQAVVQSERAVKAALPVPPLERLVEEVEDWWDHTSPGELKSISREMKLTTTNRKRWNAKDWESVLDYYVRTILGNPRGFYRGRNV